MNGENCVPGVILFKKKKFEFCFIKSFLERRKSLVYIFFYVFAFPGKLDENIKFLFLFLDFLKQK